MKKLVLSTSQIEQIYCGESKRFKVIKQDEWEYEGECHTCDFIFQDTQTNLLYTAYVGKCVSSYDWNYYSEVFGNETVTYIPVEEKEIVVMKYCAVDEDKITDTEIVTAL